MKLNNPKQFNKVFMLGLYTAHVFFNPNNKPSNQQYLFTLHLYDNKLDKEVFVGYFDSAEQLGRQTHSYILEKYTENNMDYNRDFLSISINSMVDTLDMLCYDKTTEDEVITQSNMFSDLDFLDVK